MTPQEGIRFIRADLTQKTPELQSISEWLGRSRALVFMDLDKTTLGLNYQPTDLTGLRTAVDRLQRNVLVGLHSDTPRASMRQFADMMGVKGPLIYEMAAIHLPEQNVDFALDLDAMNFFTGFRDGAYDAIAARFADTSEMKLLLSKMSDHNLETRTGATYPGYTHGVWLNPFRLFSFGLWAKGVQADGATVLNPPFHQEVDQVVRNLLTQTPNAPPMEAFDYDFNPGYGVIIIKRRDLSSKTPPIQTLLSLAGDYHGPVYMIGDSPADFIDDQRVTTLAVGNARQALRNKLATQTSPLPQGITRIAQGEYTAGAIEHLNSIAASLGLV